MIVAEAITSCPFNPIVFGPEDRPADRSGATLATGGKPPGRAERGRSAERDEAAEPARRAAVVYKVLIEQKKLQKLIFNIMLIIFLQIPNFVRGRDKFRGSTRFK